MQGSACFLSLGLVALIAVFSRSARADAPPSTPIPPEPDGTCELELTLVSTPPKNVGSSKQLDTAGVHEAATAAPTNSTGTGTSVVSGMRDRPKNLGRIHGWLGIVVAGSVPIGMGFGANLGVSAGSDRWSFVGDLRLAGDSFYKLGTIAAEVLTLGLHDQGTGAKFSLVSLSVGGRHHFSASDASPFVGAGLGFDSVGHGRGEEEDMGVAGFADVGFDIFRSRVVGGAVVLRVDAPAFLLRELVVDSTDPWRIRRRTTYAPILSAGIATRF